MGDKSGIEWTDATWNFTIGCTRVSAGCDNCYAFDLHDRRHASWKEGSYPDAPKQYHKPFSTVQVLPERLELPLRWHKPRKIFVNSLSDLFHPAVPDEVIDEAFAVMALTPRHTFQVLTKRPRRMRKYLTDPAVVDRVYAKVREIFHRCASRHHANRIDRSALWPLPNVWIGTSVEDQSAAFRIAALMETPAAVRFLSCEPLIGPLDLAGWMPRYDWRPTYAYYRAATGVTDHPIKIAEGIDWVIVGGESGPNHRPIDPEWVRLLRDQCVDALVPFMFKQWGGRTSKAGGRELDGRTWDQFPKVTEEGK